MDLIFKNFDIKVKNLEEQIKKEKTIFFNEVHTRLYDANLINVISIFFKDEHIKINVSYFDKNFPFKEKHISISKIQEHMNDCEKIANCIGIRKNFFIDFGFLDLYYNKYHTNHFILTKNDSFSYMSHDNYNIIDYQYFFEALDSVIESKYGKNT